MRTVTANVGAPSSGTDTARLAKEEADRAKALLKQAVAAGYQDVAHLKKDKDLDELRERVNFKTLVAKLEAGQDRPVTKP